MSDVCSYTALSSVYEGRLGCVVIQAWDPANQNAPSPDLKALVLPSSLSCIKLCCFVDKISKMLQSDYAKSFHGKP